jgi:ABC-type dipeptide/oligopeptide/nickel transport system permease component
LSAVVVLPTPPFWLAIAYIVAMACKLAAFTVRGAGTCPK